MNGVTIELKDMTEFIIENTVFAVVIIIYRFFQIVRYTIIVIILCGFTRSYSAALRQCIDGPAYFLVARK